jgi:RIO kinase 2
MKLDATIFRYMTKDEFRVLTATEMGMRNHEIVPVPLIESIAKLNRGGTFKIISNLLKHKLLAHENKAYDGYRLTYKGFDFLALRALAARGVLTDVGRRIGVGKESDVHCCRGPNGETLAIKLHRLGRISFRAVKRHRDYLQHRQHGSWMYMARLAALKEFAYMKALHDQGFPVPVPVDQNRHCVVMSMIDATPMYQINRMPRAQVVLERLMRLLIRLGRSGIVHSDFNEFNLLIGPNQEVTLIDFPQIVHVNHPNAKEFFERDVRSVCEYFRKKCDLIVEVRPSFDEVIAEVENDNGAVLASLKIDGLRRKDDDMLVAAHADNTDRPPAEISDGEDDEESEDEVEDVADGFAGLVPEGGREELAEPEDDIDGTGGLDEGGYSTNDVPPVAEAEAEDANASKEDSPGSDAENSADEAGSSGEEDEPAPGQVLVAGAKKKTRKKQSAKEARTNLQRQTKVRPAKANNQKVKEMRNAKHQIKEYMD